MSKFSDIFVALEKLENDSDVESATSEKVVSSGQKKKEERSMQINIPENNNIKLIQLQETKNATMRNNEAIQKFMVVEPTKDQLELLKKSLGWCPVSISSQIDTNKDIPKLCRAFVTTTDNALLKSAVCLAGIVKARHSVDRIFEDIGDESQIKQELITLRMTIAQGLDNYAKNIQEASSGFIKLSNTFATVSAIIELDGDYSSLVKKFEEIQISFEESNEKLDKESDLFVKTINVCYENILKIQQGNFKENLETLNKKVLNANQQFQIQQKKYYNKLNEYQNEELNLKQQMLGYENKIKLKQNEMINVDKNIEECLHMQDKLTKLIESEERILEMIKNDEIKEIQYHKKITNEILDDIMKEQKQSMKSLSQRMQQIKNRIVSLNKEIVDISQNEQDEIKKITQPNKIFGIFKRNSSDEEYQSNRQTKRIAYTKLREARQLELKDCELLLTQLSKEELKFSLNIRDEFKNLRNEFIKSDCTSNKLQFEEKKQNQQNKINKLEQNKQNYKLIYTLLEVKKQNLEQEISSNQSHLQSSKQKYEHLLQARKEQLNDAKQEYDEAKQLFKQEEKKYDDEINSLKTKYGHYDVDVVDTLCQSLLALSEQCQNIGTQFREISGGIKVARTSFSSSFFKDFLELTSKDKQKDALLKIAQCYERLPLIAFNLFQQPLNAVMTNDLKLFHSNQIRNDELQTQKYGQGPFIEEVKDDRE